MTSEFIQWLVSAGGTAGIAALALWMLNETWKARLDDQKSFNGVLDDHRSKLVEVVKESTKAMAENAASNREMVQSNRELCTAIRDLQDAVKPSRRAKESK